MANNTVSISQYAQQQITKRLENYDGSRNYESDNWIISNNMFPYKDILNWSINIHPIQAVDLKHGNRLLGTELLKYQQKGYLVLNRKIYSTYGSLENASMKSNAELPMKKLKPKHHTVWRCMSTDLPTKVWFCTTETCEPTQASANDVVKVYLRKVIRDNYKFKHLNPDGWKIEVMKTNLESKASSKFLMKQMVEQYNTLNYTVLNSIKG